MEEDDCLRDELVGSDVGEVAGDVENVMSIVVQDDLVEKEIEVVSDVVYLDDDNVVDRPDHEDVELYGVDVDQAVLLDVGLSVVEVVDVKDENVVVKVIQDDESVVIKFLEDGFEVVDAE